MSLTSVSRTTFAHLIGARLSSWRRALWPRCQSNISRRCDGTHRKHLESKCATISNIHAMSSPPAHPAFTGAPARRRQLLWVRAERKIASSRFASGARALLLSRHSVLPERPHIRRLGIAHCQRDHADGVDPELQEQDNPAERTETWRECRGAAGAMLHARGVEYLGRELRRTQHYRRNRSVCPRRRSDRCQDSVVLIRLVSIKVFFSPFEFIGRCASAVLQ